jgi:hypothetical protein
VFAHKVENEERMEREWGNVQRGIITKYASAETKRCYRKSDFYFMLEVIPDDTI